MNAQTEAPPSKTPLRTIKTPYQQHITQFRHKFRTTKILARACRPFIRNAVVEIEGKKYLKIEAWQAIASVHKLFVSTNETKAVYNPDKSLRGFEATAAVRNSAGMTIATAQGFLSADEFKKPQSIPESLLRAQAQNRAVSRVCRILFAHLLPFIDKGLNAAPAEEVLLLHDLEQALQDAASPETLESLFDAIASFMYKTPTPSKD